MPDDQAQQILAPAQVDNSIKADAWQAFKDSANERELGAKLQGMNLPNSVKADLWEAKRSAGGQIQAPDAMAQARQRISSIIAGPAQPQGQRFFPGTDIPQSPSRIPASMTGHPEEGFTNKDAQAALPAAGGSIGGMFGGVPGAVAGGALGESISQLITKNPNPPIDIAKQAALQGAFEGGGQLLNYAGGKLAPAAIKRFAGSVLKSRLDTAGAAIDTYLSQPNLRGTTVDLATPINSLIDSYIAKANRTGATTLADRLTELKTTWNANYNLANPSLVDANAFRRDIGDITTFAGEAHKDTLNKIQRQVVGIAGDKIAQAAPGVRPLNDEYANLLGAQAAIKQSAKKFTSNYTGAIGASTGMGLKKLGQVAPNAARAAKAYLDETGNQ